MPESSLSLDRVAITIGARTLVRELSLGLAPGERLVLAGPNGSGKSTLLRAVAGLAEPAEGSIRRPEGPPGMLFQDGALWPHMSVEKHLSFVDTRGEPAWRERLLQMLQLSALREARPERLSGGERVRLALARALAPRPRWLLLDEPLAHLDAAFGDLLRDCLPQLVAELSATTIVVTHEPDNVRLFGDRVLCLDGEGGWWLGDARQAIEEPPTPVLAALSGRGTLLSSRADAQGRVDLGLGLSLTGRPPGHLCTVFVEAHAVRLLDGAARGGAAPNGAPLAGVFVAPDQRGGSWVRVNGRLLRSAEPQGARQPGAAVQVLLEGSPRELSGSGQGGSNGAAHR